MKKVLQAVAVIAIVFFGVTGGLLHNYESIPNNAKIVVFPSKSMWLPDREGIFDVVEELEKSNPNLYAGLEAEFTQVEYKEVKNGKYKDFKAYSNEFYHGEDQSFLSAWIFGHNKRWNEDGEWNY